MTFKHYLNVILSVGIKIYAKIFGVLKISITFALRNRYGF
nr:MAG TPA: hypothetical protein [Caudoviricetes sp.]